MRSISHFNQIDEEARGIQPKGEHEFIVEFTVKKPACGIYHNYSQAGREARRVCKSWLSFSKYLITPKNLVTRTIRAK